MLLHPCRRFRCSRGLATAASCLPANSMHEKQSFETGYRGSICVLTQRCVTQKCCTQTQIKTQTTLTLQSYLEGLGDRCGTVGSDLVALEVDARDGVVDLRRHAKKDVVSMVTGGNLTQNTPVRLSFSAIRPSRASTSTGTFSDPTVPQRLPRPSR